MKGFLILNLIVQVTLTLIYQTFVVSVNFIAHTCNKKIIIYWWKKHQLHQNVTSVINSIQSKFWRLPQRFSKVVLHTGLNVYRAREVLGLLLTVDVLKLVTNIIYFMHQFDCLCNFYKSIKVFKTTCTVGWIEIKESPKYKFHDKTGDL